MNKKKILYEIAWVLAIATAVGACMTCARVLFNKVLYDTETIVSAGDEAYIELPLLFFAIVFWAVEAFRHDYREK